MIAATKKILNHRKLSQGTHNRLCSAAACGMVGRTTLALGHCTTSVLQCRNQAFERISFAVLSFYKSWIINVGGSRKNVVAMLQVKIKIT